jgi:hypothetical protein
VQGLNGAVARFTKRWTDGRSAGRAIHPERKSGNTKELLMHETISVVAAIAFSKKCQNTSNICCFHHEVPKAVMSFCLKILVPLDVNELFIHIKMLTATFVLNL